MKLTKGTWLYNFYVATFNGNKPNNNFCDYFWGLLLGIVSLPATCFMYLYGSQRKQDSKWFTKFGLGLIHNLLLILIILGFYINFGSALKWTGITAAAVCIIALMFFIGWKWSESDTKVRIERNFDEAVDTVTGGWKAFKAKNCPIVTWEDAPGTVPATEKSK